MLKVSQFVRSMVDDKPGLLGVVVDVRYSYDRLVKVAKVLWLDSGVTGEFDAQNGAYLGTIPGRAVPVTVLIEEVTNNK